MTLPNPARHRNPIHHQIDRLCCHNSRPVFANIQKQTPMTGNASSTLIVIHHR